MTIPAASLDTRVRIERRAVGDDDGYGNTLRDWRPVATVWAAWLPQYGREAVASGRLQASRPGVVRFRASPITRALASADRLVFVTGPEAGAVAAIHSVTPGGETVEATVEIGVAP